MNLKKRFISGKLGQDERIHCESQILDDYGAIIRFVLFFVGFSFVVEFKHSYTTSQLENFKLIGFEQFVQLFGQVVSMAAVTETALLVLRPWIVDETIQRAQVDWFFFIKDGINGIRSQDLLALVGLAVSMRQQNLWFWSTHGDTPVITLEQVFMRNSGSLTDAFSHKNGP